MKLVKFDRYVFSCTTFRTCSDIPHTIRVKPYNMIRKENGLDVLKYNNNLLNYCNKKITI